MRRELIRMALFFIIGIVSWQVVWLLWLKP